VFGKKSRDMQIMNSIAVVFCTIFSLSVLSFSASAGPQAVFELDKLEKLSDLVVATVILDIRKAGTDEQVINKIIYPCNRIEATCKILKVLKGSCSEEQEIKVMFLQGRDVPLHLESLNKEENAVLFLKRGYGALFCFTDSQCSKLPMGPFTPSNARTEGDLREKMGKLLSENLEGRSVREIENAISGANAIGYSIPDTVLNRLSVNTNVNIAIVALVPLVQKKQTNAVMRAFQILLCVQHADRKKVETLAWAVEGSEGILSVAQVNQLATSSDILISRIGMRMLRSVGDESSVPALLTGLTAKDNDTQHSAVVGLSRLAGQKGPSLRGFMQNREAEVTKWKEWGKTNDFSRQNVFSTGPRSSHK
jgi:hypothetical protein